jgi:hypothetical protein
VVPIGAAPSAAAAAGEAVPAAVAAGPQVFAGRAAAAAPALRGDVQTLLLGAVGGAVLTLLGVLVGYRLGRGR